MIVTRFNYPLEKNLVSKLDLMIKRVKSKKAKKDVLLIIEGGEGEGKTTYSVAIGYYVGEKTGRYFGHENVFFDLDKMIEFAKKTDEKIIIWDEPALQSLSTDWQSKCVKDLTRLLMTARKKRHFIIINMVKFYKFNEYVVVDRAIGMINVYSRKNIYTGRFRYIKKANLEPLWRDYRFSRKRNYVKYSAPHIKGSFPDVLNPDYENNVLSEFNIKEYEKNKDAGIESIGNEKKENNPETIKKQVAMKVMRNLPKIELKLTQPQLSTLFEVNTRTIQNYAREIARNTK